ncbi:gamma carbonic anhydrase family protein [Aliidiomarina soli]|uniref:Gamma carbonic anhydrase family protein n=1 Tax=Aliidiomarina soli TaxID=1928574 RepID=A0A432WIH0_9GAMM|nr:gamma carbonic anhydrase family protein [Aliidiomarina soli]RUO33590.1 gamma carbonic anhydrase family protein [Aliidiomarina soli]
MSSKSVRSYKGKCPQYPSSVYIDESAVLVGDITLGEDSSVWPLVAARGDVNFIRVGARSNIQDACVLHVTRTSASNADGYPLIIGDDVTLGHKVMLHGCQLGNRILVGMGAIVMDGAVVEDDVMIAAGALVAPNKTLESGYLYVGSPAQKKRPLNESERDFLQKSSRNYVELKNDYLAEMQNTNRI